MTITRFTTTKPGEMLFGSDASIETAGAIYSEAGKYRLWFKEDWRGWYQLETVTELPQSQTFDSLVDAQFEADKRIRHLYKSIG